MGKRPSGTVTEMAAVPPARSRPGRVRPYLFAGLPRLERVDVELSRRLHRVLPEGLLTGEAGDQVRERLRRVFDEDVQLWLDYVHAVPPPALSKLLSEPTVLGVVATSPHAPRGLVELELGLAHQIIDLLLGAGDSPVVRPLTEIEQGVVSYVLLETFKAISPAEQEEGRERLRLEKLVSREEGLALFANESAVAVVELKVLVGQAAGFMRLLLPGSAIQAAPSETGPRRQEARRRRLVRRIGRLSTVRAWLWAEVGRAELTAGDLCALQAGDVILLDSLTARVDRGEGGRAVLRVGSGRSGGLEAALEVAEGRYRARIEKVVIGSEPFTRRPGQPEVGDVESVPEDLGSEFGLDDEDPKTAPGVYNPWDDEKTNVTEKSEANPHEAVELLNDVPLQVAVELARIAVTAEEIAGLHVGKILELGKAPGEPVDLSVNGKVLARGELVEVEGQLGVRIASLAD